MTEMMYIYLGFLGVMCAIISGAIFAYQGDWFGNYILDSLGLGALPLVGRV